MTLVLEAPAKVNLCLHVGPPAPDGYHPLSTVFCALDLADTVELTPDPPTGPGLDVDFAPPLRDRPPLGDPAANLAVRAAESFFERARLADPVPRIRLTKRIPPGGGLGGGSSDAGAVLRGLARAFPGAVTAADLGELAAGLGADVPFFLAHAGLARATGRGDRVEPLPGLPSRPVVLALPRFGVATADAYGWLDQDRGAWDQAIPDPPVLQSWADAAAAAMNDLEAPVFARHPALREIRDRLRALGARVALLAGSGSSVFGVFEDEDTARSAEQALSGASELAAVVRTATRGPDR